MTNLMSNSESLQSGRSFDLDSLWEMSQDATAEEVRQAAKLARKRMFNERNPELASLWRDVMDSLFTIWLSKLGYSMEVAG